jgi:hypothetical protein
MAARQLCVPEPDATMVARRRNETQPYRKRLGLVLCAAKWGRCALTQQRRGRPARAREVGGQPDVLGEEAGTYAVVGTAEDPSHSQVDGVASLVASTGPQ